MCINADDGPSGEMEAAVGVARGSEDGARGGGRENTGGTLTLGRDSEHIFVIHIGHSSRELREKRLGFRSIGHDGRARGSRNRAL